MTGSDRSRPVTTKQFAYLPPPKKNYSQASLFGYRRGTARRAPTFPFSSQEKVRIAMPRLCEASGDATSQREGGEMSLELSDFVTYGQAQAAPRNGGGQLQALVLVADDHFADGVAHDGAHEHVRQPVVVLGQPRQTDRGGQAVAGQGAPRNGSYSFRRSPWPAPRRKRYARKRMNRSAKKNSRCSA